PSRLREEIDESLRRLGTDRVELLYLHSPDPNVPLADSAAALLEIKRSGKALSIGASNFSPSQLADFHAICPISAVQLPYNMLQRGIEQESIPWCRARKVSVMVYWPLMKGLLAGKLQRGVPLEDRDPRRNQPMFQGEEWQRNH